MNNMKDLMHAFHATHQASYTPAHLDMLARWYDDIAAIPVQRARHACIQTAKILANQFNDRDSVLRDIYQYVGYMSQSRHEDPRLCVRRIAQLISDTLRLDIVCVRAQLSWTDTDYQYADTVYSAWTHKHPLIWHTIDTQCLAGFQITTHPIHRKRITYDGTLASKITRFAQYMHQGALMVDFTL